MSKYKLFKKTENYLKFLTPLQSNSKSRVAKVLTNDDKMYIGYNENEEMFLEIAQCPRIYVGMELRCKNMDTNQYEDLGKLVDIQYREDSGFLFIFQIMAKFDITVTETSKTLYKVEAKDEESAIDLINQFYNGFDNKFSEDSVNECGSEFEEWNISKIILRK